MYIYLYDNDRFSIFIVCYYIVLISGAMSVFHNCCTYGLLFYIALFYTACFIYVPKKEIKKDMYTMYNCIYLIDIQLQLSS